jgi:Mn-dependent DtxR family transcriptional regulator
MPSENRYLRAMAELGPGPHRSGEIARVLQVKLTSAAPTRRSLIKKGRVDAPSHGDTALTVPLFDEVMTRRMAEMPELDGW